MVVKSSSSSTDCFSCPGCERTFARQALLRDHFSQHYQLFRCSKCQKAFKDALALIQHYQCHNKYNNTPRKRTTKRRSRKSRKTTVKSASVSTVPKEHITLQLLEQELVLRYLNARCHPLSRLQTEGYIFGPLSVRGKMRPSKYSVPSYQFRATPPRVESLMKTKRHAIALRCEMVRVSNDRLALAFIGMIDFLTGDILINKYVRPVEKIVDWRSEITGVTRLIMNRAIDDDEILDGWQEARQILWEFIDEDTVIVGHSLNFDLEALGICHTKVVDSAIVAAEAVSQPVSPTTSINRMWDLKALVKSFLAINIEVGRSRHGALENAYSARDVVIWYIRNPEQLRIWAEDARAEMEKQKPGDISTDIVSEEKSQIVSV